MKIIKDLNSKRLERKLPNGLTEVKEFFNDRQLMEHYFLNENGKRYGECKIYYPNGQLYAHCFFNENGEKHGEYKDYFYIGELKKHLLYENGEIIKENLKDK